MEWWRGRVVLFICLFIWVGYFSVGCVSGNWRLVLMLIRRDLRGRGSSGVRDGEVGRLG